MMFKNLKLGPKFTLILSIVFVVGIVVSGFVLWEALLGRAQGEVTAESQMLIDVMNAVRWYTSTEVNPLFQAQMQTQLAFVSQSVPAFSAREVFEKFRGDKTYSTHFYKEAATNPTNPRNKADEFETEILTQMRNSPGQASISGFRTRDTEWVYYTARPLVLSAENCLVCHSTPEQAPASLLATYGSESGFGWQLNDVVAAQMLYVPASEVFGSAIRFFVMVMAILVAMLAIILVVINLLLRADVIQPIALLAGLAGKIGTDEMTAEDLDSAGLAGIARRTDELGQSATVFQRMAREIFVRTRRLKEQIRELTIEIDETKRIKDVAQVVESDFFRNLKAQAGEMRGNRQRRENEDPGADEPSEDS
jgi:hypothetical protein